MTAAHTDDAQPDSGRDPEQAPWKVAPIASDRAPVWDRPIRRSGPGPAPVVWLLGAHGGAGVSTLEATWAPAGDSHRGWPAAEEIPFTVVVARMHAAGLRAAHQLILQYQATDLGRARLLGLVTVAAAPGKPPVTLARRREIVAAAVAECGGADWHIGWISGLLEAPPADLATWQPGDPPPAKPARLSRPPAPTEAVPTEIARVGGELFAAAHTEWADRPPTPALSTITGKESTND